MLSSFRTLTKQRAVLFALCVVPFLLALALRDTGGHRPAVFLGINIPSDNGIG